MIVIQSARFPRKPPKLVLRIPDDDLAGWFQVFREMKLTYWQIDDIMMRLNDTYAWKKLKITVFKFLNCTDRSIREYTGRPFSLKERESMKLRIFAGLRETQPKGLPKILRQIDTLMTLDDKAFADVIWRSKRIIETAIGLRKPDFCRPAKKK
jgi:hypothetical protein